MVQESPEVHFICIFGLFSVWPLSCKSVPNTYMIANLFQGTFPRISYTFGFELLLVKTHFKMRELQFLMFLRPDSSISHNYEGRNRFISLDYPKYSFHRS